MKSTLKKLTFIFIYLIAVAVSIKSFREPDLWWQIRTGEWIMEHHEVPKVDVFSYTLNGTEWINIKWGFEVILAAVSDLLGPESVFILQAIVNCLLVFFLFRLSRLYIRFKSSAEDPNSKAFIVSGSIAFLILIVASEYRMIGRPEMISHLMTIVFLYILEQHRIHPSKKIYLLIPLQLLWANLHEAFGIGLVLLTIYVVSSWINHFLLKTKRAESIQLTGVALAVAASAVINPHGIKLLTRPFNIMSQVYSNKYTTELLGITSPEWWKKEAYIVLFISLISIVSMLAIHKRNSNQKGVSSFLQMLINPYLLVIFAFLYLGIAAYRNLIFLGLVCFPVFHFNVFNALKKIFARSGSVEKYSGGFTLGLLVLMYIAVVSNVYYSATKSRDTFGLEVLSVNNPVGAADYIRSNQLEGKKGFSDYLTSSYLLWKLQPAFRTYIDLRDLDVFPAEFFDRFLRDVNSPYDFHQLDSKEQFDYAVVFRPQFDVLHSYLYNDSVYALKYVDAVAAVYQKTDDFSRADIFTDCKNVAAGPFATAVNKILNPLYKPYNYAAVENDYIAANYYLNVSRLDLAHQRAEKLVTGKASYKGYEVLAQLDFRSSINEKNDSIKSALLASAEEHYRSSLRANNNYAPSLLGVGVVHFAQKNYASAIKDFSRCLSLDHQNYQAHLSLAQCYREMIAIATSRKEEYKKEMLEHFLEADALNPGNPMVIANIGFAYFQMNDCDHATAYLSRVAEEKSLAGDDRLAIENCLRQCGY